MNRKGRSLTTLFILLLLVSIAAPIPAQKKAVTLQDVFMNQKFFPPRLPGLAWLHDGMHYTILKTEGGTRSIWKVHADSGEETLLIDGTQLIDDDGGDPLKFQSYEWSDNDRFIVFTLDERNIWRRSTIGTYAVYDVANGKLHKLPDHPGGVMNVKVSPDGTHVGYVFEDNIYIMNLATGQELQLTHDARTNVHNGRFGWVYEEEFSLVDGWLWSPDSKAIAFWQEDETQVPEFTMTNFMPLYPEYVRIRYPKPGANNPVEKIGVIDLGTLTTTWMDLGEDTDICVPRMQWTRDPGTLCITRMNRVQSELTLLFADIKTGRTRTVVQEQSQTGWIGVEDGAWLHFLAGKDQFIWASERDGYNHLYLYDYRGKLLRQITAGRWEITEVLGMTSDEKTLYYLSTEVSPLERHLFRIDTDGDDKERLTDETGWHTISMSPTCARYFDTWSSITTPTQRRLCDGDGSLVRAMPGMDASAYDEYHWSAKELFTVTTADGVTIDCAMLKPANFDPAKKYPVFFDVYGGPGTQAVRNSWPQTMQQWYASEGFIVIQADNRGSGGRGTAFKHAVYRQLGKWEVHDYVAVATHLATLPYVNAERIGIWGWSYGGYMAALTMLLGAEHFHTAVSIAPVTDWRFYDTIYTERFMQTPEMNPDGYAVGSCVEHAGKLTGNLLIVHGGLDDNVHLQNTMTFIDRLEEAGKQFDMRIYPNGDHGVAGGFKSRLGLFQYYVDYMKEHLIDG
ncbi:MAG: S9 family peptidase [Bacteroidota bacterium]|jgi:dipeptidyl-peptidase-4|nr:S9 family peptidase [Bacteroidota bacterium]